MNFIETVLAVMVGIAAYYLLAWVFAITLAVLTTPRRRRPKSSGNRAGELNWRRVMAEAAEKDS